MENCIRNNWPVEAIDVIENSAKLNMSFDEFLNNCTACGGNWGGMLLSGLKELSPEVYAVIPSKMGETGTEAFFCLCEVLEVLNVK